MPGHLLERDEAQRIALSGLLIALLCVFHAAHDFRLKGLQILRPRAKRHVSSQDLRSPVAGQSHRGHCPRELVDVNLHGSRSVHQAV
ncbi:MAG: hypothetical protein EBS16_06270 [Betaproteobacteria bacterium]|nr:hypothetical protein [Betaproteobacteria bacterium]